MRRCIFRFMMEKGPMVHQHDIHFVYDGFEKVRRDAGAVELKGSNVFQISKGVESNKGSDIHILDARKTQLQALLYG